MCVKERERKIVAYSSMGCLFQLSSKLIQDGFSEDVEHMITELNHQHQKAMEAKKAELDAEEAGLVKEMIDSLSDEHITQVKMSHQNILNNVCITLTISSIFYTKLN